MQVKKEEIDSLAFGASVLKIENIDINKDFDTFEKEYIKKYSPIYVYSKVEIENLQGIQYLEKNGFGFVETQFKKIRKIPKKPLGFVDPNFELKKVEEETELPDVYNAVDRIFNIDRVFLDKELDPNISKKRYRLYIKKSFFADNEVIYKLIDKSNGNIAGVYSHLFLDDKKTVVDLLGGIAPEYKKTGAIAVIDDYVVSEFIKMGLKYSYTYLSARNYPIIELALKIMNAKLVQAYVVLRKIYKGDKNDQTNG